MILNLNRVARQEPQTAMLNPRRPEQRNSLPLSSGRVDQVEERCASKDEAFKTKVDHLLLPPDYYI